MPKQNARSAQPPPLGLLLPVDVAAAYSGCLSRSGVYLKMADGTLPSVKVGRARRIPRAAIEAYVAALIAEQNGTEQDRGDEQNGQADA